MRTNKRYAERSNGTIAGRHRGTDAWDSFPWLHCSTPNSTADFDFTENLYEAMSRVVYRRYSNKAIERLLLFSLVFRVMF